MIDLKSVAAFFDGKPRAIDEMDRMFGTTTDQASTIRIYQPADPLYQTAELHFAPSGSEAGVPQIVRLTPTGQGIELTTLIAALGPPKSLPPTPAGRGYSVQFFYPTAVDKRAVIGAVLDNPPGTVGARATSITIRVP